MSYEHFKIDRLRFFSRRECKECTRIYLIPPAADPPEIGIHIYEIGSHS
jgi:hypothetical protein